MLETRLSPLYEFKFAGGDAAGNFAGYASTFMGTPDAYGDLIAAGAFAESLKEHQAAGSTPALLWAHDTSEPIGRWSQIKEDRYGLAVEGKLTLATKRGQEARALMQDNALGLSIGYRVAPGGSSYQGESRILKKIQLFEISAVAIPANPAARVTSVKSATGTRPGDIRQFESFLRDAGFSTREAKRLCAGGWAALMRRDDAGDADEISVLLRRAAQDFQTQ